MDEFSLPFGVLVNNYKQYGLVSPNMVNLFFTLLLYGLFVWLMAFPFNSWSWYVLSTYFLLSGTRHMYSVVLHINKEKEEDARRIESVLSPAVQQPSGIRSFHHGSAVRLSHHSLQDVDDLESEG